MLLVGLGLMYGAQSGVTEVTGSMGGSGGSPGAAAMQGGSAVQCRAAVAGQQCRVMRCPHCEA